MDFNLSKECVGKALLIQSPPGTPWDRSQAAGCLIRVWMRLCCRKTTEKTIATPWLIDFYCDGNSLHGSSLQQSHHFLLPRATPSTPVQWHPGWQCVRHSQLIPNGLPVSRSQDLSVGGASRQRWHGQHLAGSSQEDWCTPTAQQLISSKQLHQEITAPDKLPPLEHTHLSPAFPEYRFFPVWWQAPGEVPPQPGHRKAGYEPTAFIWLPVQRGTNLDTTSNTKIKRFQGKDFN